MNEKLSKTMRQYARRERPQNTENLYKMLKKSYSITPDRSKFIGDMLKVTRV